ncbi:EVI5-like protein isoform X5 [Phascolarctos cinereus]|uniref:EVI5-like protein isoform X1 n=1 Tax=Phascolarctos cinereus TaxID=38626 RepID=A0A6P5JHM7_PHACI|nr:EVI5-like protein isoform X1 [Phascolarctos cinereus]XP_020833763.1 EVI5-like protein isoform X1 [Phascolarctos cinereus]XP_020833764.1 EVI5-like protein isoform X1 [Phascolarctos cinereus]XP_020833765.1 EVI5-like protein isoform X1 [Phascolarctos cinereus]
MNVPETLSLPGMASPALSPDSSSHEALSGPACSPTSDSENLSPDELELLAKLEEQNRLLEADSKSMRSMNGSRRNSGSSLVSSSSASSNLSHLEEDTWILWGRIVNEWEEWRRKKEKLLKELIRKGIPHHFRAIVWQLLCSATDMPVKNQYSELLKMSSPCEKLIRRDIARTYPEHEFFKGQDSLGQEVLFNVMKAYSLVDREVGYCQGSAFIVGLLLMQMPEEEAFCVFVRLMQEYRLRELFKPSMAELGLCIYQFEYMLQEQLPDLNIHFRSQSFHTSMYASSWFLTLFLTTFPLPIATRVFDIFMYEGLEIVFRVGLALLQVNQMELMQLDMEGMSQYFQKVIPHQFDSCPDKLILKAYQVKYNPKKMKRLEKEYAAIKNKEMEEQIEIKRLRTENRLLKQRIETLEKESAALADRLIQGQVTRAQEAEENYVIKRELAVVKQQCSSATENLQKAQSTIRQLQEQQDNPRLTEEFVAHLETELEQSRMRETETLSALREMQDKVLDMEKRNNSLPDENNVARLQEELKGLKLRESEAVASLRELKLQVQELTDSWQAHLSRGGRWKESPRKLALSDLQDELMTVRLREAHALAEGRELRQRVVELETQDQIHRNLLNRVEAESAGLQEKLHYLVAQNKGLQTQLSESKRKHAEAECKSKEEVMAVRLREADSMAAVAEMRQRIAELEIQREEGMIQGQLNHSDSSQYIRELKDQIDELKAEVRLLKGPPPFEDPLAFDSLHLVRHLDEDSLPSSDEELLGVGVGVGAALQDALYPLSPRDARFFRHLDRPAKDSEGSTDSEADELAPSYGQSLGN